MTTPIKLHINPQECVDIPDTLQYKGQEIQITDYQDGCLTMALNESLSIRDHIRAVEDWIGEDYIVTREKPQAPRVEFNIVSDDLTIRKPLGRLVWDSVFRKPEPVSDAMEWYQGPQSDEYVYLPNNLRKTGPDTEEYMSNAMYTEVLTHAYRRMCNKLGIAPWINLADGTRINGAKVQPSDGAQPTSSGSRAARLANSRLDDYDDSIYAVDFIQAIIDLEPHQYESEIVRRKVLAKVEHILMGKTSHVYNQRFIQRLLDKVQCSDMAALVSILTGLVSDGFILEDSEQEFTSRVLRTPLVGEVDDLIRAYGECRGQ